MSGCGLGASGGVVVLVWAVGIASGGYFGVSVILRVSSPGVGISPCSHPLGSQSSSQLGRLSSISSEKEDVHLLGLLVTLMGLGQASFGLL